MTTSVLAAAKVNLALHVTGQRRGDGYHLLDSLVVFAETGDVVSATRAGALSLSVSGAMAGDLPPDRDNNLVLRAARLLSRGEGARITLEKVLPVAAGLGGGSSDAAATLRALSRLWGRPLPDTDALMRLGADVPVCLEGRPSRMRGTGETVSPVDCPSLHMVLVNPGLGLSTPAVFSRLREKENPPLGRLPAWKTPDDLVNWLTLQRNDLEAPAIALVPEIDTALRALRATPGCRLARMSGSGASCFGLFDDAARARAAGRRLLRQFPQWWVAATRTGASSNAGA